MKGLSTAGRMLFALPMAVFGIQHFMFASNMAGIVPAYIPGGVFWVYATGLALILAAAGIITKRMILAASITIAAMMLVFIATIHIPMMMSADASASMMGRTSFLKDTVILGGALFIAGAYGRRKISVNAGGVMREEREKLTV
ncbi:MAG TPA: hypothetical protein VHP30_02535 [Ignavibacteriales bacterium]|nr:hypothetical protein [Ignavibacteriales bacterium]